MSESTITLPAEILRLVLRELQALTTPEYNHFTTAFRVCPTWREVGESLLWTDICLADEGLSRFMVKNTGRHTSILSLTIIIDPVNYEYTKDVFSASNVNINIESPATAKLWKVLRALPAQLRRMSNLSSFSLKVRGYHNIGRPYEFWLKDSDIYSILESLHLTVTCLEIDSYCYDHLDDKVSGSRQHICVLLRSMLPHLTSLRLRLSRLCTAMIPDSEETGFDLSRLASESFPADEAYTQISINTIDFENRAGTQPCHPPIVESFDAPRGESRCRDLVTQLFEKSVNTWGKGSELRPVNLSIIELYGGPLHTGAMDKRSYPTITNRTLHPCKTVRYPYIKLRSEPNHYFLRHRDIQGQGTESCGYQDDILDVAEGHVWVETAQGYRIQTKHFHHDQRFKNVKLKPSPSWSHDEYLNIPLAGMITLWLIEQRGGRLMLRAEESQDLNDVGWVERDKTDDEIMREKPKPANV